MQIAKFSRSETAVCWPTQEQLLLLRAASHKTPAAWEAWQQWKTRVELNHIDKGSYRLLPLVYYNLKAYESEDSDLQKMKGVYRHTWSRNHIFMAGLKELLLLFHGAGIQTMILKGAALLILFYRDYGLRPMNDMDVLVPFDQAKAAIDLMRKAGYAPADPSPVPFSDRYLPLIHAFGFSNAGKIKLDLHWHVFQDCRNRDSDEGFWKHAVQVESLGSPTLALNPTDQLLHVCIHGLKWDVVPPIRWVADASFILKNARPPIDWERLISEARSRQFVLALRESLRYLKTVYEDAVPDEVIEKLQGDRISRMERMEYNYRMRDYTNNALGMLPLLWFSYKRTSEGLPVHKLMAGFIRHLCGFWGVERWWQFPFSVMKRIFRRIGIVTKRLLAH